MAVSVGGIKAPRVPPAVPWVLGFAGLGVLYAAIRNESPTALVRAAIQGRDDPGPALDPGRDLSALAGAGGSFTETPEPDPDAGGGGGFGARGPDDEPGAPSDLVQLDGFRLRKDAAEAFTAWERAFGRPIPVTTGYRSYETQRRNYDESPGRFASPESSLHVQGVAVDVNNDWLGSLSAAEQSRLRNAARVWGWGQARYKRGEARCGRAASGRSTDNDEPWHFSFGACG